jgi:phosphoacetylglucosamine mutase
MSDQNEECNQLLNVCPAKHRPSGEALVAALVDGLKALGASFTDLGIKTTPQLHYFVRCLNTQGTPECYGEASEQGYYNKLGEAYIELVV